MIYHTVLIAGLRVSPPPATSGCVVQVGQVSLDRADAEALIALLQEALS